LIDADFDIGSVTEEESGPGWFTVSVTGRGYAAAAINADEAVETVRGKRIPDARSELSAEFPLAEPPQFALWPEWPEQLSWLERMPLLTVRIDVNVTPKASLDPSES
jgi:hypothetical protein